MPSQIITISDLVYQCELLNKKTEAVVLKSGFKIFRSEKVYWEENPVYSSDLYSCFRNLFPLIRFLGFDTISLTSLLNRDIRDRAHKQFLCSDEPILIIQDMLPANVKKI